MRKYFKLPAILGLTCAVTIAHGGTVNWTSVYTQGADGDTALSLAGVEKYTAFCLSEAAAQEHFGTTDIAGMSEILRTQFDQVKVNLTEDTAGSEQLTVGQYGLGQYGFTEYAATGKASDNYLAVLFYEDGRNRQYRVFGEDAANLQDGDLWFDDASGVGAGSWSAAVLPEPTGGLLLLLGLAVLGLRRSSAGQRGA